MWGLQGILIAITSLAMVLDTTGHEGPHYECNHDELVEPYHQQLMANLTAVGKSVLSSLNPSLDLPWAPGQTEMAVSAVQDASMDPFGRAYDMQQGATPEPEPIRIHVDYQIDSQTPWGARRHLEKKLVPQMIAALRHYVKVKRPVRGKLKLPRECLDHNGDTCMSAAPVDKCGSIAVHNPDYFGDMLVCSGNGEGCTYRRGGSGLDNTDFVLYITAQMTSHCSRGLLAFAGYCVLDVDSSRPLAGFANFCPNSLSRDDSAFQAQLETALHESFHALAFSTTLFPSFIDPSGKPWGSENVTQYFQENGRLVRKIITPTVVQEARKHFDCPSLNGGELEDEGGPGIAGSHWESRIFQYEIMDGQAGNNMDFERHVVSGMTLAVLEDSGWYEPNWSAAQTLELGHHAGCEFLQGDCHNPSPSQSEFYCTSREDKCVWDRTAQGTCDQDYFLMDGCSYVRPYKNTVCTNISDLSPTSIPWGQMNGPRSRCLEHDTSSVFIRQSVGVVKPPPLGCYEMYCDWRGTSVYLKLFDQYIKCPAGELLELRDIPGLDFLSGAIGPCPSADSICPGLNCPNACTSSGRCIDGVCECFQGRAGADCSSEACTEDSCQDGETCNIISELCEPKNGALQGGTTESLQSDALMQSESQQINAGVQQQYQDNMVKLANGEWVKFVEPVPGLRDGTSHTEINAGNFSLDADTYHVHKQPDGGSDGSLDTVSIIIAVLLGALCALLAGGVMMILRHHWRRNRRSTGNQPKYETNVDGASKRSVSTLPPKLESASPARHNCHSGRLQADSAVVSNHGMFCMEEGELPPMFAADIAANQGGTSRDSEPYFSSHDAGSIGGSMHSARSDESSRLAHPSSVEPPLEEEGGVEQQNTHLQNGEEQV